MRPSTRPVELDPIRPLAASEFTQIRELAYRTFGLDLKAGKEELVSARLRRLVQNGAFRSFQEYYQHVVRDTTGAALAGMIDALATNHTSFMREADHFKFLREEVLPTLKSRPCVEIWSAACSSGEEVWTLVCLLNESLPARNFRITGSDISNKALRLASQAIYPAERAKEIPADWLSRYFRLDDLQRRTIRAIPQIRTQAVFKRLNLLERIAWPQKFPVIFCRNVMIYFDRPTQERVVAQLSQWLEPGGYLFVGHAESLGQISHGLTYVRPAVYRKANKG